MAHISLMHLVYLVQQRLIQIQAVTLMQVQGIIRKVLHTDIGTVQALHKQKLLILIKYNGINRRKKVMSHMTDPLQKITRATKKVFK